MTKLTLRDRTVLIFSAILASISMLVCAAAFQFDFRQSITQSPPQSVQDFLAAPLDPYEYRSVKNVFRPSFDCDIKLRIVFDDVNKLSGSAIAIATSRDASDAMLGEALGDFLAANTGIIWLPVTTSGSDYKKLWTSASSVDQWERSLTVKFKIKT